MKGDRVVTELGIGHVLDDEGRVWIDRRRPRGAYLLEEIEAEGLAGVRVWLERPLADAVGRRIAGAGEAVAWEVALEHGLVGPVRVARAEMSETRGASRG